MKMPVPHLLRNSIFLVAFAALAMVCSDAFAFGHRLSALSSCGGSYNACYSGPAARASCYGRVSHRTSYRSACYGSCYGRSARVSRVRYTSCRGNRCYCSGRVVRQRTAYRVRSSYCAGRCSGVSRVSYRARRCGGCYGRVALRSTFRARRCYGNTCGGSYGVSYASTSYGCAGASYVSTDSCCGSSYAVASPVYSAPIYSAPTYSTPVYNSGDVYGTPLNQGIPVEGHIYNSAPIEGTPVNGVPVNEGYSTPTPAPIESAPAVPADGSATRSVDDAGTIVVQVPANAKVFVNNVLTKSTGTERTYVSHGLVFGNTYTYKLRVEYMQNGKLVRENRNAKITAGGSATFAFGAIDNKEQIANKPVSTKLTLNVPKDAKVYLSGNLTSQTGEVREFTSKRLTSGKTWKNYTIRVDHKVNGQLVTQQKTIDLASGASKELTFDFAGEGTRLAQLNR